MVRSAASSLRSVHFLGHLKGQDVWKAYCSSDVFVLPTLRDSWALVVNEAMAARLPTIVSNGAGCIDDLVLHGETGFVYPRGSRDALFASMHTLAASPQLRAQLGQKAAQLISDWTLADEARAMTLAWDKVSKKKHTQFKEKSLLLQERGK